MRHINIPIFIPHLGCPNDCVFCNQRTISGKSNFELSSVDREISTALSGIDKDECEVEIAFFGGSFTGIDRELMKALLNKADGYVSEGKVDSIRLSTRPDYIDEEILDILSRHKVTDIELGIQSVCDAVLRACKRGHTAEQSDRACCLIKEYGFNLVGQMMIGLPCSTPEDEINTAEFIVKAGADGARIYPLIVFANTELDRMSSGGLYTVLSEDETVERSANALDIFARNDVRVLRIGLCAQDGFDSEDTVTHGRFDPAIGEKVQNELFLRRISEQLDKTTDSLAGKTVSVCIPMGATSKVVGHKRRNIEKLRSKYGINALKIIEKTDVIGYNILIV